MPSFLGFWGRARQDGRARDRGVFGLAAAICAVCIFFSVLSCFLFLCVCV